MVDQTPSAQYRIREVDGADDEIAETLLELDTAIFGDTAPRIKPEEGYWWAAYHGKEIVAYAGMSPSLAVPDAGYLDRCGVMPDHRGHRLQARLLRVRENKARKLGWTCIRTDTTSNPPSSNSLIRAGYKIFTPRIPWAFNHTIYWKKEL